MSVKVAQRKESTIFAFGRVTSNRAVREQKRKSAAAFFFSSSSSAAATAAAAAAAAATAWWSASHQIGRFLRQQTNPPRHGASHVFIESAHLLGDPSGTAGTPAVTRPRSSISARWAARVAGP